MPDRPTVQGGSFLKAVVSTMPSDNPDVPAPGAPGAQEGKIRAAPVVTAKALMNSRRVNWSRAMTLSRFLLDTALLLTKH
jgi:hypothetical protein